MKGITITVNEENFKKLKDIALKIYMKKDKGRMSISSVANILVDHCLNDSTIIDKLFNDTILNSPSTILNSPSTISSDTINHPPETNEFDPASIPLPEILTKYDSGNGEDLKHDSSMDEIFKW